MTTDLRLALVVLAGLLLTSVPARAQGRVSPHETVSAVIDGATISISYGRPYMKGRTIMGDLVPYGPLWRMGADEATTLVTDRDLMFGRVHLPAGSYSLFAVPGQSAWTLIVNSETGQSGLEHNAAKDLAKIDAKVGVAPTPVEQFTIAIVAAPAGGVLTLRWERTEITAPFTVAGPTAKPTARPAVQ